MFEKWKQQKEVKKRILYKKTLNNMRKYVSQLEKQKTNYIRMATEAKINGSEEQMKLSINGLKMALAYQKKAKEMLLNFELSMQLRDLSQVTGEFLKGMVTLSNDMSKIISKQDYAKVTQSFEKAMGQVEKQNYAMENFMNETESSFDNIAADPDNVSDKEIAALLDDKSKETVENKGNEIDLKIKEIEKLLNDL